MLTDSDIGKIKKKVKDEITPLKNDLSGVKKEITCLAKSSELEAIKSQILGLAKSSELDKLKIAFEDNLTKWKSELFTKIDSVLGRVKTADEENIILKAREEARAEMREGLDSRITKLELIHPQNRHSTT